MPLRLVLDTDSHPEGDPSSAGPSSWFKALLWAIGPAAPATSVDDEDTSLLRGRAAPDGTVEMAILIENHQSAVSLIRPMLSALVGPGGAHPQTAAAISPRPLILRAGERTEMKIVLALGEDAPLGEYRGRLFLLGTRSPAIGLLISHDGVGA